MIKDNPDAVSGHWMKVQMLMIEKDWDAVLEATEQALERFPDEETLTYLRGRAFQEKQDLEHAIQCYNRAIGMKPSFAGARAALGEAYEKQDKLELAEEVLLEVGRANPDYSAGPVSLALFLGRWDRWDEAESLFLEAWPKLPAWFRGGLLKNPKAAAMLERPAVKQAVAEADPS
jgi:tetratricopeptide (TPR) repeat protein